MLPSVDCTLHSHHLVLSQLRQQRMDFSPAFLAVGGVLAARAPDGGRLCAAVARRHAQNPIRGGCGCRRSLRLLLLLLLCARRPARAAAAAVAAGAAIITIRQRPYGSQASAARRHFWLPEPMTFTSSPDLIAYSTDSLYIFLVFPMNMKSHSISGGVSGDLMVLNWGIYNGLVSLTSDLRFSIFFLNILLDIAILSDSTNSAISYNSG